LRSASSVSTPRWSKSASGNGGANSSSSIRPARPLSCARIAASSFPALGPIAEYLDETRGLALAERRLLPEGPGGRIEVRRLLDWFNIKFNEEITAPLVLEKVMKRFMSRDEGGGPPEMSAIRAARGNVRYHLRYIAWLTAKRNWLAGDNLSYADLAAAAHLSCVDYLGDVPWDEDEAARAWYARIKSRPSFRPLLSDRIPGMAPSAHYDDLDF
jgi:glutathione S-transferase